MNVELMLKTADYIEQHPQEYDQGEWGCGTEACIAGTACMLAKGLTQAQWGAAVQSNYGADGSVPTLAAWLLDIPVDECDALFFSPSSWPQHFRFAWLRARSKVGRAKVAAHYLRFLVKQWQTAQPAETNDMEVVESREEELVYA